LRLRIHKTACSQEENTFLPDYPAFHIYKDEDIEDYFTGDR
jgi:hypothetical protein